MVEVRGTPPLIVLAPYVPLVKYKIFGAVRQVLNHLKKNRGGETAYPKCIPQYKLCSLLDQVSYLFYCYETILFDNPMIQAIEGAHTEMLFAYRRQNIY